MWNIIIYITTVQNSHHSHWIISPQMFTRWTSLALEDYLDQCYTTALISVIMMIELMFKSQLEVNIRFIDGIFLTVSFTTNLSVSFIWVKEVMSIWNVFTSRFCFLQFGIHERWGFHWDNTSLFTLFLTRNFIHDYK